MYSEMIFLRGFIHCDPHPGNILVRKGSKGKAEIIMLDHGLYRVSINVNFFVIIWLYTFLEYREYMYVLNDTSSEWPKTPNFVLVNIRLANLYQVTNVPTNIKFYPFHTTTRS